MGGILHGCSTNRVHSEVDDSQTAMFSGTLIVRPDSWRSESGRRGQGGVEFGYEHQSGSGTQDLKIDEFVQYDPDTQLPGPQTISHRASIDHGHIAYNRLWIFNNHFQLEPSIGLAHDEIRIDTMGQVSAANTTVSLKQSITGITVGVIPRWYFNRYFGVEIPVRFGIGYASRADSLGQLSDSKNGTTEMINPSLLFCPAKNVALSVGYVYRDQYVETNIAESNLDLNFRGVSAAIRVSF
jgi:hypothetical protein